MVDRDMVDRDIEANQSLILNGDFNEGFSSWTKGGNTAEVVIAGELYDGTMIKFLAAANRGTAAQEVTLPVEQGSGARYVLSFLCETRHANPGTLRITTLDGTPLAEIPLPPGNPKRLARIDSGQPLDFVPVSYNIPLDLPLPRQQKIRVTVISPVNENPEEYYRKVCITRIHLGIHLAPLVPHRFVLDREHLSANAPLYLCLGADGSFQHQLECVPAPDSPWQYTPVALTSDDNPQGAVRATPDWGVAQPLESFWTLYCPLLEGQEPFVFTASLVNQYSAEPYPIEVSLGHHRLVFSDVLEAAYYPVLELAQSVRLGVRVASFYTGQYLAGRTVTWTSEGQEIVGTASTDAEGWAYLDYRPKAAGTFAIEASVASPYYAAGVETTNLEVQVLATDPWADLLAVVEDNALPWAQKTGYPNRGSTYPLKVRVPPVLRATTLALHWQGTSAGQLGVQVQPQLEQPVAVGATDLNWVLTCDDQLDGRFELQLRCSKLLLPSDWKPMSLARNVVRIGAVQEANKFPVVDEDESVLLRVQVVHVLTSGDGDPVNHALVDWDTPEGTISTVSGSGGWASVLYQPSRAGEHVVTARVRAHAEAVVTQRAFAVRALASNPWKREVRILFDDVEVDLVELGLLCWKGTAHTLKLVPNPGSPLINYSITLDWRGEDPRIGLSVSDLGVPRVLGEGLEWTFSSQQGSSLSSLFALQLSVNYISVPRELFGRLIATDLAQELSVMLDQVPGTPGESMFYPCLGARHTLRFLPNPLSPLVGLEAFLEWQGTPPADLNAVVEPALELAQTLADGGTGWTLDFAASAAAGQFSLQLRLPGLARATPVNAMQLDHNKVRIEGWRETPVDPVINQDAAWQWVQVVSAFTGEPVTGVAVRWHAANADQVVDTDAFGWSGFALAPTSAGQHQVVAQLLSRFDNYQEQRELRVTALASDPWQGVRVRFDGHLEQTWGARTYFPRRSGNHVLELLIKEDSPLLQQELTLGLTGTGPAQLGLTFEPALGVPRQPSALGFRYTLRCADLMDGGFALRLSAARLASLSPANAMSLGTGEQVLKLLASSIVQQVLEWGQTLVEEVRVVSSITGQGIAGVVVTWRNTELETLTSLTDFYGMARVQFKPQIPGASMLTATVGDALHSESIALAYTLEEPRKISELIMLESAVYPGAQVLAQATIVSAIGGQPLSGVEVMWTFAEVALPSTVTDAAGRAIVRFNLDTSGIRALAATVRGGEGGWDYALLALAVENGPIIQRFSADRTVVYPRQQFSAQVTVVRSDDGRGWGGLGVVWDFAGGRKSSVTGPDGGSTASNFLANEPGVFPLTSSVVDYPYSRSIDIEVVGPDSARISDMKKLSAGVFQVLVTDGRQVPLARKTVFWRLDNSQLESTITGEDGRTTIDIQFQTGTRVYAGIEIGMSSQLYEFALDF
ncbi:hypothetical protein I1A_004062 [Pseudomonas fluorescens R124]|uniref:Big-1 domain-containing protein n=1 Tax=Pseudomonas fluorescens R124 TaxID=743713 RepID=A0A7U9GU02_PSEFL|nr:hypothetical protein [Pseudomonas fluorescens]EJZ59709.1 hypothetical protein I1A_004062 [Pseudomonas fluorescens R124]